MTRVPEATNPPVPPGALLLELVPVPVTDIDRAKAFYTDQLGFAVDVDITPSADIRIVQLTPPASSTRTSATRTATPGACNTCPGVRAAPP